MDRGRSGAPARRTTGPVGAGVLAFLLSVVLPVPGSAQSLTPDADWGPVVSSLVLPGLGQLQQDRSRGWAYIGLEVAVWAGFGLLRAEGRSAREAFRGLAWEVARAGSGTPGDGDFDYYERLGRWPRSGSYDLLPETPGVQPETDPATFNGDAWALARQLFGVGGETPSSSPAYAAALAFYQDRAYDGPLLWDWTGNQADLDRYRHLMRRSDRYLGNASLVLGGAVLNRLASGIDAYLTQLSGRDMQMRLIPVRSGSDLLPHLTLRVVLP